MYKSGLMLLAQGNTIYTYLLLPFLFEINKLYFLENHNLQSWNLHLFSLVPSLSLSLFLPLPLSLHLCLPLPLLSPVHQNLHRKLLKMQIPVSHQNLCI